MSTRKNLLDELVNYLFIASPVASVPCSLGGGIAAMSSIIGARYYVRQFSPDPALDSRLEPRVVTQSVILHGASGSCKGNAMEAVRQFFRKVDPDYPLWLRLRSAEALWRQAEIEPPMLVIEHENHLRWARQDITQAANPGNSRKALDALLSQTEGVAEDVVARPYPANKPGTKPYIRHAPPTALIETTPGALDTELSEWMEESPFYGAMLLVPHDGKRHRSSLLTNHGEFPPRPSEDLISRMRRLREARRSPESILVQLTEGAVGLYRGMLCMFINMEPDAIPMLKDQTLNVAALYAIGRDWETPIITEQDLHKALLIAGVGREYARQGLRGTGGLSEFAQELLRPDGQVH